MGATFAKRNHMIHREGCGLLAVGTEAALPLAGFALALILPGLVFARRRGMRAMERR